MKSKPRFEYIKEFHLCDKEHFLILKGIAILLVVLAHFCEQYLGNSRLMPLQGVAAAVFLLCSGYGVSESFKNKKGLTHYWENKAIKVWLPSLVVTVLFSLLNAGNVVGWVEQNPLALHGWFLYLVFGEYVAFWLAFYFLENKTARIMTLFAASAIGFLFVGSQLVAIQMFSFPVGVLFSQMDTKYSIREMKIGGRGILLVAMGVASAGAYILRGIVLQPVLQKIFWVAFSLSAAAFLCLGVYFARKIGVFGIFAPVGMISYALYLLHEQVLTLLEGRLEWRIAVAVFVGLFLIAAAFSWLCWMMLWYSKRLRRSKNIKLKGSIH